MEGGKGTSAPRRKYGYMWKKHVIQRKHVLQNLTMSDVDTNRRVETTILAKIEHVKRYMWKNMLSKNTMGHNMWKNMLLWTSVGLLVTACVEP